MAKLTAWLVTIVGALLTLGLFVPALDWQTQPWVAWVISLAVLVVGIGKLTRNYRGKRR